MIVDKEMIEKATSKLPHFFSLNELITELKNEDSCGLPKITLIDLERIVLDVCQADAIDTRSRKKENVYAKILFASYVRQNYNFTFQRIAEMVNGHHSTVLYYCKRVEDAVNGYDNELLRYWNTFNEIIDARMNKLKEMK